MNQLDCLQRYLVIDIDIYQRATFNANRYQLVLLRETKESISVSISYIFLATKITDLFRSKMVEKLIESRVPRTKKYHVANVS